MKFAKFDSLFIDSMHRWGVPLLRITLGIVFLWFGALKVADVTPVRDLIEATYSFFPTSQFLLVLGVWEMIIGIGLIFNVALRVTLALLWLQMLGTILSPLFSPSLFFQGGNPFFLTVEGEFVVKNLVLIAASVVIGGYAVHAKK